MRIRFAPLLGAALALGAPAAWSIPSPSLDDGSDSSAAGPAPKGGPTAQDSAAYAAALALMKQGDELGSQDAARAAYASARTRLQALTARSPQFAEAWNALGYTQRRLGAFDDALASYGRALELKPGYPEALEYRGEAYLRLNRVADAKQAYLDLFATNRTIAATLLEAMRAWITAQEGSQGADATVLADLREWVQERARIATQTAALTRAGAAASWR